MTRLSLNLKLYKKVFLIRAAEEKIREVYHENEMKTPVHLAVGQEAIAAGVCQALRDFDQIFATYRNHGIYLARVGETNKFFAELFGRKGGMYHGKGGSMHMSSPEHGFLGTSAVVGTNIPLALGNAYAQVLGGKKGVAVAFFGDGAIDEGVFWESLNFACLKRLPVLFVCEDNDLAIHSKAGDRHGYKSITQIVKQFDCRVWGSQSTDAEEIYKITQEAIRMIRTKKKPVFLHLKYYRYYAHVGIKQDFKFGYRSENEFKRWLKKDPVKLLRNKLLGLGCPEEKLQSLEKVVLNQIEKSMTAARRSPFPQERELSEHVYYGQKN